MKIERLTFVPSVREMDDFDGIPLSLFKYRITFLDSDQSSKMADPLEIGANGRISRKRDKITVARYLRELYTRTRGRFVEIVVEERRRWEDGSRGINFPPALRVIFSRSSQTKSVDGFEY